MDSTLLAVPNIVRAERQESFPKSTPISSSNDGIEPLDIGVRQLVQLGRGVAVNLIPRNKRKAKRHNRRQHALLDVAQNAS